MRDYEVVIGLEVHAQLKTKSKIFCSCSTQFGAGPNENTCPVCTGMPGMLPVLNARAVEYAVKMAMAVDCTVNRRSLFARKNYFYPDLPMGYQISQFELPVAEHGHIVIHTEKGEKRIGITRIHMENDAGKNIHSATDNASYVDLNRAGVPLIEIVSEPDMRSAEEAVAYLKSLRAILVYLGICDGNLEEGSFRCDANVSIRPRGQEEFGTRAELKNMNSFRNIQRAIEYEVERQIDLVEDGEQVVQETRLFDTAKGVTRSMRGKEEAHDYRYFPDPDLLPLIIKEEQMVKWRGELPELPEARCRRFQEELGLPGYDSLVLTAEKEVADYFETALATYTEPKKISNWVMGEVMRELNDRGATLAECKLRAQDLARLVKLVDDGLVSGTIAKNVFKELFETGGDPEAYVKAKGLVQISDTSAIEGLVDEVLAENPSEVERYKGGDKKLTGFFVGQVMKKSKGKANPGLVNQLLAKKLG
ncbi:Asp-tRNA(Asn)/Glu-tRNA(Gln) amidotransferase subunit GatB [Desulfomicrobium baculatum]|uniref:Aspartyl/glutamyl-tRNA(Asn/Gln) amidotransferase subunit B n=1 Tax=Desulfomicrobium baculatum (strain DSM 4028 / VKM B-1378 / X) TaxID=525897 RepID=C7LUZ0_DESBD|nr:Asp-tRNA(Asn)/Glu-tRNA(Gln) amidotransferase subunit GatB [Desulfomicrobium baculatum]ACU88424.1 glutamyl-tRNA(Gln) amidotransferase, B subunit [Desulfomicrobium baculatum DSM 4028]